MGIVDQQLLDAIEGLAWVVDGDGVIQAVGTRNWSRFAAENGAPALADLRNVIGRPLVWSIIGSEVQGFYRRLMEDLLSGRRGPLTLLCRCDAPERRRDMRLAISAVGAGDPFDGLLFQSVTFAEEDRPPLKLYDFNAPSAPVSDPAAMGVVLAMCSLCQRVRHPVGEIDVVGEWIEAEEHYRRGGSSDVRIYHSVCADCARSPRTA